MHSFYALYHLDEQDLKEPDKENIVRQFQK